MIAQSTLVMLQALPSLAGQQSSLLPLVFAALLLDSVIIALWYMLGWVIGNNGVKAAARGELYQLIGTAIIIIVVMFALATFSGLFVTSLSGSDLLGSTATSNLCTQINNNAGSIGTPIPLLTAVGVGGVLCSAVNMKATSDPITNAIDYPLAATGVVLENLTYQAIVNLNSLFVFDAYLGFLTKLTPTFSLCVTNIPYPFPGQCIVPPPPVPLASSLLTPFIEFSWNAQPYAGEEMIFRGLTGTGILFTTATESFVIQLIFVVLMLYAWPMLIFVGLVLRSTFFTRKLGGLFIAVAIGAVFFYPLVFSVQYLTLGHGLGNIPVYQPSSAVSTLPNSISSIYGYNNLVSAPITALPATPCSWNPLNTNNQDCATYTPNFYIFPSIETIATYNNCWPPLGDQTGAITAEASDIATQLIPFVSLTELAASLAGGLASQAPPLLVPFQCFPYNGEHTLFQIVNAYGIYGISAYLLPILDIMITVSAILGLSYLLGGDTELAGLGKLV